jgi:hypothetical protein
MDPGVSHAFLDVLRSILLDKTGCSYQKLYPCGFSGVREGEIRMGLRPKIREMPLPHEIRRVPDVGRHASAGTDSFLWRFDQEFLGCLSLVTMMQATDLRQFNYSSQRRWLDRARNRSVFCQGQMSARSFVIVEIQLQHATQTAFVEDEDGVETVTPDRADYPFDVSVLPRRARCAQDLLDVQRLGRLMERFSVA